MCRPDYEGRPRGGDVLRRQHASRNHQHREGAADVLLVEVAGEGVLAGSSLIDYFEHVPVHRVAEEETRERRGPERLDQFAATLDDGLLQLIEARERVVDRDVAPELALERRDFKPLY